ncbi:type II toxin-antitoxin system VapC family toxin [[Limnothrix rosea] IAM M-220]|uniref:type II toxin-antitoxin system VapC family toxin n=1 Tax=[Limnothrix rosea] IAM M-220 TaxID=454133 RepID=UPI000968CB0D|nr:PIN domain-containing protein [[Limnothrix rosea] IAM M-220]OKH19516.1 hypothetical protein NIES208_01535 [[Limnothrix rosea] IAM M-220]
MDVVCLDTNIVIWGIQQRSHPDRKNKIPQAMQLIANLQAAKNNVIVPSCVFAELLMGCNPKLKRQVSSELSKFSKIVPFDIAASYIFGELATEKWGFRKEMGLQREKMKFDMMIVATAVAQKAGIIYAGDGDIEKIVQGSEVAKSLQVRDMPPYQPGLFDGLHS